MQPRIDVGDVVLAAPETDPQAPARPRRGVHRPVFRRAPRPTASSRQRRRHHDRRKGDANPNADTAPAADGGRPGPRAPARRRSSACPMIWMHTGPVAVPRSCSSLSLVIAVVPRRPRPRRRASRGADDLRRRRRPGRPGRRRRAVPHPPVRAAARSASPRPSPVDPGLRREWRVASLRRRAGFALVLAAALLAAADHRRRVRRHVRKNTATLVRPSPTGTTPPRSWRYSP